jgi:hypothetical protein
MLAPFDLSEQSASDFVALAIRSRAEVIGKNYFEPLVLAIRFCHGQKIGQLC